MTTHRYAIYGTGLSSTLEFPELAPVGSPDADMRWTFTTTPALPAMRDATELGAERIYGEVFARLIRHADGHRITVDDTGRFEIGADGRTLWWEERADAWPDFVRAHLMGRVLATAMFNEGWLPLHGSAVTTRDGVVAFLAPKGFGKTTLALALTRAGARLVTDDMLPLEFPGAPRAPRPLAWPGVHSMRVRDDSARSLGLGTPLEKSRDGKGILSDLADDAREERPRPLAGIYLLDPVSTADTSRLPARTAMPPMLAALGVVAHVKIGGMLGPSGAGAMLERATAVAAHVPVHRLHLDRNLARLPAVAATILGWHGGTP